MIQTDINNKRFATRCDLSVEDNEVDYRTSCEDCSCNDFIEIIHGDETVYVSFTVELPKFKNLVNDADVLGFEVEYSPHDAGMPTNDAEIKVPEIMYDVAVSGEPHPDYPNLTASNSRIVFIQQLRIATGEIE